MARLILSADSGGAQATLVFKDKKGNPGAKIFGDGIPKWSQSPDGVLDMIVSDDGMTAKWTPTGKPGVVTVHALAEGEETEGEQVLDATGEIEVIAADAEVSELVITESGAAPPTDPETPIPPVPSARRGR